ncbi:MAG TPA: ATP-binding domain-containing protein [Trebonia sp.]|nr:ATP-binding domain-containing protein [Trebonia sp.]
MASNNGELAAEQAYVTALYERLDALRASTKGRLAAVYTGPTAENDQAYSEREEMSQQYRDRAAELDAAERNLCFGRLDFDDEDDTLYIGRVGLRSEDHETILVDWRARAAEPFYRATARDRMGVTRRRHLHLDGRRVVGVDDDVLDLDAVDQDGLAGEAALMASLRRHRTGRMADIVATIQADQDRVIRSDRRGILVVEGGPGTGKTVVALHRAAYLLYTHRKLLAGRGILVLGPSGAFLRYIDQVLPSLGESDVVLATSAELYPGVVADGTDAPGAARVKGDAKMARILKKAVEDTRQVPAADIEVQADGTGYRITPRMCRQARAEAEQALDRETGEPLPHNRARRTFIATVAIALARQSARGGGRPAGSGDARELAAHPAVLAVLDALWPELEPQALLARLYRDPGRLALEPGERAAISAAPETGPLPWTPADVALLDELAELIGPSDAAARRARADRDAAEAGQAAWEQSTAALEAPIGSVPSGAPASSPEMEYAAQIVSQLVEDGTIVVPPLELGAFVTWIAARNTERESRGDLAQQALGDRAWAFGHVIVDEAQELSAMDWRMVARRCPARSMTVVGDLAQTAAPGGADNWAAMLDPVAAGRWRTARLTVNYRTPAPVMDAAAALLPDGAAPPVAARDSSELPWTAPMASLSERAERESALVAGGRVAVIAAPSRVAEAAAALGVQPGADLGAPVAVLTPQQSKGLEFDSVIVVDAAGIEAASPRGRADLYVALTRATRRLGLVGPVPQQVRGVLERQRAQSG